jgi:hypothetical protein
MRNVPRPLSLPHPGTISESNNLAEADDDDHNNDNDNNDNHDYEYVHDNNVAVAQKANDNELIAHACPTCPRKKNRLRDVDNDNINNYNNNNNNNNDSNNYKRTNADDCLDNHLVFANDPIYSAKRKQMSSKKSVTSSMSRRESVAHAGSELLVVFSSGFELRLSTVRRKIIRPIIILLALTIVWGTLG